SSSGVSSSGVLIGSADESDGESGAASGFTPRTWLQALGSGWTKRALLTGIPATLVVLAAGIWLSRPASEVAEAPPAVVDATSRATAPQDEQQAAPAIDNSAEPEPEPLRLARRWLPTQTQALVSLRPKLLLARPAARVVLDRTS